MLEKEDGERREVQVGRAMHSKKKDQGTPGSTTTLEGTSSEPETCPMWQLGAGLDGVLSSQPYLRAFCEAFLNRQEVAQLKQSQGCSVTGQTPEHLVRSLRGRGHDVGHITGGQLGDNPRSLLAVELRGGALTQVRALVVSQGL